MTEFNLAKI